MVSDVRSQRGDTAKSIFCFQHPLPVLIANGVPTSLCNDDCTQFGNVGLTFDYYSVRCLPVVLRVARS